MEWQSLQPAATLVETIGHRGCTRVSVCVNVRVVRARGAGPGEHRVRQRGRAVRLAEAATRRRGRQSRDAT